MATLTGPKSRYRPKQSRTLSVTLTIEGRRLLELLMAQSGLSRSDAIEALLRGDARRTESGFRVS